MRNCTIYSPESDEWNFLADSVSEHTYGGGIQLDEGRFWITGMYTSP